jgi:sortase family protein
MGYSGHTGPMPAAPRPAERHASPRKWDSAETQPLPVMRGTAGRQESTGTRRLPEDWWDPEWQAVQSPGAVPLQPEIMKPGGDVPGSSAAALADEVSPSWGQVLGNTFGLWTGRHLRWRRRPPEAAPERAPRRRGRIVAAVAMAAGLATVGVGAAGLVTDSVSATPAVRVARPAPIAAPTEQTAPAGPTTRPAGAPGGGGAGAVGGAAAGKAAAVAKPVWVSVPAIGIKKTTLIHLGLTKSGALQVPDTTTVAGWFAGGPRPGAVGSAVIAGHVDSKTGPGIFFWLRALKPGDRIYVGRADGTMAVFAVTRVHQYAKDKFPTGAVYGAVPDPELRLITCGGIFDRSLGSYLSNVVVFARLLG